MGRLTARQRGYSTAWEKARRAYLRAQPWCVICFRAGHRTVADTVDHVIPHKGNDALFCDRSNWQATCTHCHNSIKQREEHCGVLQSVGVDGLP